LTFDRMPLEIWFDEYQFEVDYDIGESGTKFLTVKELDIDLNEVELRYGYHLGHPDLRKEIAKQYKGKSIDNIAVTTGASEANFAIIAHLVGPKDNLIVEHPTYPSLYQVARSLGRDLTLFKLDWDDEFRPDMDKLRKPDAFFSWLLGIADLVAKEHVRKEQLHRRRQMVRSFSQEAPPTELSQDYALETAIAELPEAYRKIILLRYYGGHSCNQIAEQLDMPLGTVTKTLSRAYAMLRDALQQQEQASSL